MVIGGGVRIVLPQFALTLGTEIIAAQCRDRRRYWYDRARRFPEFPRLLSNNRTRMGATSMNIHDNKIAPPKVTTGPIAGSRKATRGRTPHPSCACGARDRPRTVVGRAASAVYDPSGPYTDPDVVIDVDKGCRARVSPG